MCSGCSLARRDRLRANVPAIIGGHTRTCVFVCVCLLIVHGVHAAQCGRCRLRTYPPCLWYSLSALTAHTHSPNSVHKNSLNACIFTMFIHVRCELRRMCVWCVCVHIDVSECFMRYGHLDPKNRVNFILFSLLYNFLLFFLALHASLLLLFDVVYLVVMRFASAQAIISA